jgi:hypothetical protein
MDETQKVLIQGYGGVSLMLSIDWRTHESWFEVYHTTQKTKYKTFAEAEKAMQEVIKKEDRF